MGSMRVAISPTSQHYPTGGKLIFLFSDNKVEYEAFILGLEKLI